MTFARLESIQMRMTFSLVVLTGKEKWELVGPQFAPTMSQDKHWAQQPAQLSSSANAAQDGSFMKI